MLTGLYFVEIGHILFQEGWVVEFQVVASFDDFLGLLFFLIFLFLLFGNVVLFFEGLGEMAFG